MDGVPLAPFTLRVTHLYRRENSEWKIVHRHADATRPVSPSRRRIYRAGITAGGAASKAAASLSRRG
jgi:hypothetical protein